MTPEPMLQAALSGGCDHPAAPRTPAELVEAAVRLVAGVRGRR